MSEDTILDRRLEAGPEADAELALDYDARNKRRFVATLADGRQVRVQLARLDTPLHDGERLAGETLVLRIRALPETLIEVRGAPFALMRGAYHLGNRHAKVMLGEGFLRTPDDPVMRPMLEQLGLEVLTLEAPFDPEVGAYHHHGHSHGHSHDEAAQHGHGEPKIHRFVLRQP